MIYPIFLIISAVIITILLYFLERAFKKINELEHTLKEERRKRSMPLLTVEVDTETEFGIFLINDSYCYAKNITVNDLDVVVDYGFKKHITLKFDTLDMLKPNGRSRVDYRVFDGEYETTNTDSKNILNHFSDTPIEIHLRYENIEGGPFAATIIPEDGQYVVKEVTALESPQEESR